MPNSGMYWLSHPFLCVLTQHHTSQFSEITFLTDSHRTNISVLYQEQTSNGITLFCKKQTLFYIILFSQICLCIFTFPDANKISRLPWSFQESIFLQNLLLFGTSSSQNIKRVNKSSKSTINVLLFAIFHTRNQNLLKGVHIRTFFQCCINCKTDKRNFFFVIPIFLLLSLYVK